MNLERGCGASRYHSALRQPPFRLRAISQTQMIRITTGVRHMLVGAFWFSVASFLLLFALLLSLRVRLEHQRAALDELYLAEES